MPADPIITEADSRAAELSYKEWTERAGNPHRDWVELVALALAQARAEGRLAGMEEAARVADAIGHVEDRYAVGAAIRARTTKEG